MTNTNTEEKPIYERGISFESLKEFKTIGDLIKIENEVLKE